MRGVIKLMITRETYGPPQSYARTLQGTLAVIHLRVISSLLMTGRETKRLHTGTVENKNCAGMRNSCLNLEISE